MWEREANGSNEREERSALETKCDRLESMLMSTVMSAQVDEVATGWRAGMIST